MANTFSRAASDPNAALTVDFLTWLASGPRAYSDVMEAWRTSCPRLSIWEDAVAAGWVRRRVENGRPIIELTGAGAGRLRGAQAFSDGVRGT